MGSTSKPLTILAHTSVYDSPELQALKAQGHNVQPLTTIELVDLILAPNAWMMSPNLLKYLPMALRSARTVRYGGTIEPRTDQATTTDEATTTAPARPRKRASTGTKRSVPARRRSRKADDSGSSIPTEVQPGGPA